MLMSTIIGFLLSVVAFSTLVVGDPGTVITLNSATVTNNANDYWDPWSVEITKTKKSSQLTMILPLKKQLPDTMQMKMFLQMKGLDPIEYVTSVCDALDDGTIGKSFVKAGVPKDKFPKECPIGAGDWSIVKWDPPTYMVPPGISDGPISGNVMIMEDGKKPYVIIDYDGEISHMIPGIGR